MKERVIIFSNGTQYMQWNARNCDRCSKVTFNKFHEPVSTCPLWNAIADSMCDDGDFTPEMAKRLGHKSGAYTWDCPERNADTDAAEWDRREREAIECGLIVPPKAGG